MALAVIDFLKAVHVAEEEGRFLSRLKVVHILHEGPAVHEAGELVSVAHMIQAADGVPASKEGGKEAGEGGQEGAGFFSCPFRGVHHLRVAQGFAAGNEVTGDDGFEAKPEGGGETVGSGNFSTSSIMAIWSGPKRS